MPNHRTLHASHIGQLLRQQVGNGLRVFVAAFARTRANGLESPPSGKGQLRKIIFHRRPKTKPAASRPHGVETVSGSSDDYLVDDEVIFGADWKRETEFLESAFEKHADREVKSMFEPTARLRLVERDFSVH